MRVLVLFAHPVDTSFSAALHARVVETLAQAGHTVDDLDLYAEGFDPVLSRAERLAYHDVPQNRAFAASYVERLLAAEGLVIVAPVWNYGFPAILKGYFDRVFLPGVTLEVKNGRARTILHNVTKLVCIATYGGSRLRTMLLGDPPRRFVKRALAHTIRPGAPTRFLALYDMNRATATQRGNFMKFVTEEIRSF